MQVILLDVREELAAFFVWTFEISGWYFSDLQ